MTVVVIIVLFLYSYFIVALAIAIYPPSNHHLSGTRLSSMILGGRVPSHHIPSMHPVTDDLPRTLLQGAKAAPASPCSKRRRGELQCLDARCSAEAACFVDSAGKSRRSLSVPKRRLFVMGYTSGRCGLKVQWIPTA